MSEPNAKRRIRHYDPSYLQFGFISSPDELKPFCLTCHVCLANDSMRPHHLKAHQFSKHPTEVGQQIEYFGERGGGGGGGQKGD